MFLLNFIPWYLWNKYKLLKDIDKEISLNLKKWWTICDLFSWSGVIWDYFKSNYNIISNDIEYYSYIINKASLNFNSIKISNIDINKIIHELNLNISQSLLTKEINDIESYLNDIKNKKSSKKLFFYENFSGTYFSINQWLEIDYYRLYIDNIEDNEVKNYLLSIWVYALYNIVNSVWNHFAQARKVKNTNFNIIEKKFKKSFLQQILNKHNDILENIKNISIYSKDNQAYNLDYKDLLKLDKKIDLFYIDTPYTIDHYSRFYHILNTFLKYDYPTISWVWLYREDRYQSKFCRKTTVREEFEHMIKTIHNKYWAKIILSYSDSYRSLLHKDIIFEILSKYYKNVKLKEINYSYSWLWQSSWNNSNELLFTAIN